MKKLVSSFLLTWCAAAQSAGSFQERVQQIMNRPEFRHARFGMDFYSLETGRAVYKLNADQLFVPGSTTKLLTVGTALLALGPDYRFHTRIYRTGPIDGKGTLKGNLVLVASGDPNLSNRVQADGTLAFENVDHSYAPTPGAKAVPGDPLAVIHELAKQVASKGVKRIQGGVRVDKSLFAEGAREGGTDVVISPVAINDNVIDVTITPGAKENDPAAIAVSPESSYVRFVNRIKSGAASAKATVHFGNDEKQADGSHEVAIEGSVPAGSVATLRTYHIAEPGAFAALVLEEALQREGIRIDGRAKLLSTYAPADVVAEHVSPPLIEEAKVTLKVSQNLHASMLPYIVGAVAGRAKENADQAGFDQEHTVLEKAGLDVTAACQSDGAGAAAFFTPDFMVHFLEHISKQPFYEGYLRALPILGRDGTLWDIQVHSPAAGQVHAKTGTYASYNALDKNLMIDGKGLAGYLTTKDGHKLAFAVYANLIAGDQETVAHLVGDALGEIAAAAYDSRFEPYN